MVDFGDAKDPDDIDDFTLGWADRLASGETITGVAWAVVAGTVVIVSSSQSGGDTTVRLSGGAADEVAQVRCRATLSSGRQLDETMRIRVKVR